MKPLDVMWTEKYRPENVDDMVGEFKDKVRKYLENSSKMQHLLLSSTTPGTGKTTLAKAIVKELGADKLILNSSDDRKIESVREKVTDFVKTKSSNENERRVVIMDEADGLTPQAQDALRNLMEFYSSNALFILTCNKNSKIIDAIKSRCVNIEFSQPDKEEIFKYLKHICDVEGVDYNDDGLRSVVDKNYPSIRNCIQVLQSLHTEGKSIVPDTASSSDEEMERLWKAISVQKDWKFVKDYVFNNESIDIRELNMYFWYKSVQEDNIKMMQVTASNEDKFVRGGEELVVFVTSLVEMAK